jgi:2',3'-cyclic-nucleotide 2'-phosphodiesterase (5'-nucleotidase family)
MIDLPWLELLCLVLAGQLAAGGAPDLPFSDINVVVVTDVHSWVGGHRDKEPAYTATYGDVISFVEHLKAYATTNDHDVWFIMNGDWIDGTGLAMNDDPSRLIPILEKMPWDAVNVGNHELYHAGVIEYMTKTGGLVEWFGKKYLSSNVMHTTTMEPIGYRYQILHGKHADVLTFGFLYDMKNSDASVTIQEVEAAVEEDWFVTAVSSTDDYDAVLVLAHMDVRDPLCLVILDKIRTLVGDEMPVQFITGHTHKRDYQVFDPTSTSFEAGRYLDTVGFVSFPSIKSTKNATVTAASEIASSLNVTKTKADPSSLFHYKFIDANVDVLAETLGMSTASFPTELGVEQSEFILRVQIEMGLKQVIGCVADTYYLNRSLDARDSLWGFFQNEVVPSRFSGNEILFLGDGAWRYDLFTGDVRFDDVIAVSPFNSSFWMWEEIPAEIIVALNNTINEAPPLWVSELPLPQFILSSAEPFQTTNRNYSLIVDDFEVSLIESHLQAVFPNGTDVPSAVEMPRVTSTSIWLDYFQEDSHTCKAAKGKHPHKKDPSMDSSSSGAGFASADPTADSIRLMFVGTAVLVMAVLGSLVVYQKGTLFRQMMEARDFASLEAIREYDDDEEFTEEGEFV